jgi:hypothetical protein
VVRLPGFDELEPVMLMRLTMTLFFFRRAVRRVERRRSREFARPEW